jgi:hypothetical protein
VLVHRKDSSTDNIALTAATATAAAAAATQQMQHIKQS